MKTLAERMLDAANTLEEASRRYGAAYPQHWQWTPAQLRKEAEQVEG